MKLFKTFHLDTANHILGRDGERIPIAPKAFDVLAYLVEHAGRLVTQDEILEALWSETYVNPEVLRKYILEIRRALGDRPDKPEFVETLPKRGYRFIAPVVDESTVEPSNLPAAPQMEEDATGQTAGFPTAPSEPERASDQRRLWKFAIVAVVAILAAAAIAGYFRTARQRASAASRTDTSIAVLPFSDMSPAKDQEYFSDGLAQQLINDLAKVSGLKVIGWSSAFQFRGSNEDARDVGRKLGVGNILEGSVRREGNHVRITAELIKADDGFQLWSQTYDQEMKDIFTVQDEIAQSATTALQLKLLGTNGHPVPSNQRSANPDAYQAYLQGNYLLGRGQSKEDLGKALAYVDTAIKLDPRYAAAWALRATVENLMAAVSITDVTEGFRKARDDAEQAIALDPASAPGYLALARIQLNCDWNWDTANACLAKAAALEPGNVEVFRIRSQLSWVFGNPDQAVKFVQQAAALDPLRSNTLLGLGFMLYVDGRYDEAQDELQKALDLNPQAASAHATLAKVLIAKRKPQQALAEIEKEPSEWQKLTGEAFVYHALGREQDSNAALADIIAKHATDSAYQIAQVYGFRGDSDKSFEWLDRAYRQRDPGLSGIKTDPLLKNLHRDPRYSQLLHEMRLPA